MLHHQKFFHLQHNEFFGLFPSHVRTQLMNKAETRLYKAGKIIFKRGEEGPWMAAILAGRVRISLESHDKKMLLSMFERGEIFGERALLDGLPRGADAFAEEDTTLLIIKRDEIVPLLHQYPDTMFSFIKILCNRLLRYTDTMELYTLESLPTRLASYLLFLASTHGQDIDGKRVIRAGLNQSDLAQKLAASRESINRQLKAFETQGFIHLRGHEITLLEPTKLEQFCEELVSP
jgi:CRP-like cAMP-binding protein